MNAGDLLGGLLQGTLGGGGPSRDRLEHAMGERGLGGAGGPLGQILGGLGGGGASGGRSDAYPASGGGGGLGGLADSVDEALGGRGGPAPASYGSPRTDPRDEPGYAGGSGGGYGGGQAGGMGGGDILGGLASILGGRAGGMGGGGLGGGGMGGLGGGMGGLGGLASIAAAVLGARGGMGGGGLGGAMGGGMRGAMGSGMLSVLGMMALRALMNSRRGRTMGFADTGSAADPTASLPESATSDDTARLVLHAMIDAAKADGQIDREEYQRIVAKAQEAGDEEGVAYLERAMSAPADPDGIASQAAGDPVVAAQVYAASLMAIRVDTEAEQNYLVDLAGRLGLDEDIVVQLHQQVGAPAPQAAV